MLPDDGVDPEDGTPINPVYGRVLALLDRDDDDLSDLEHIGRQTDAYWYIEYCVEKLHRLPSEIDQVLGMREYTALRAHQIIARAYADEMRQHQQLMRGN